MTERVVVNRNARAEPGRDMDGLRAVVWAGLQDIRRALRAAWAAGELGAMAPERQAAIVRALGDLEDLCRE